MKKIDKNAWYRKHDKYDSASGLARQLAETAQISSSQLYKWAKVLKMVDYYASETLCKCCEKNIKKANQIVCDHCHSEQSKPLLLSDDEEDQ
jgi:hypothetical protein